MGFEEGGVATLQLRLREQSPALALRGVSKHWPGAPLPVLNGVDLVLDEGTATRLGGRNGVGKTTLLRIAAGLIEGDHGGVRAFGLDPVGDRRLFQRRVGYLSAGSLGLYARLSARDHLEFHGRLALLPRVQRRLAIERELDRFGLQSFASRRVDRLSMGQRQRVRVAITLLPGPQLILLDEPLTSLDHDGSLLLDAALTETMSAGGSVVWCTPHADDAGLQFGQSLVLEEGRLWPV